MVEVLSVAIFCEDVAHERLLDSLTRRIAAEVGRTPLIRTASARGGHGRALTEFVAFQNTRVAADLVVVGIDANCKGWNVARKDIEAAIDSARSPRCAIACPDPHVERWYMADPESLRAALDVHVSAGKRKCERDLYKRRLADALEKAGHPVTLGGAEFAREIVGAMDLFRAGKNEPSLKHFLTQLRAMLSA